LLAIVPTCSITAVWVCADAAKNGTSLGTVRIRLNTTPAEKEIEGISLAGWQPGTTREVSATVGSWLIAQGYAQLEMRRGSSADEDRGSITENRERRRSS
jgi:hypothetical protein